MTWKLGTIIGLVLLEFALGSHPVLSYDGEQDWHDQQDLNDTEHQLDHADDVQFKMDHEREGLETTRDQLEKALDDLQRNDQELTRDIDMLTEKQHAVSDEIIQVNKALNDTLQKLQN